MILRYGLVGLGLYTVGGGLFHHSTAVVLLGVVVIIKGASLFQAHRVAKRWQDEAARLSSVEKK